MNIFVTDEDPQKCAQALDDKRVNKMIVESAQMLCTALHLHGFGFPDSYRPTHQNHPCTQWAAATLGNFEWLWDHGYMLSEEWSARTGKIHATHSIIEHCGLVRAGIPEGPRQEFINCTDYKDMPIINAYRKTMLDKWATDVHTPKWSSRRPPIWSEALLVIRRNDRGQYFARPKETTG